LICNFHPRIHHLTGQFHRPNNFWLILIETVTRFPEARKSDPSCYDSNGEVARWRRILARPQDTGHSARRSRRIANGCSMRRASPTLVAALRIKLLTVPYVIDGTMDGPSLPALVEQIPAPTQPRRYLILRTHEIDGRSKRSVPRRSRPKRALCDEAAPTETTLIGRFIETFAIGQCANYSPHAGYAS